MGKTILLGTLMLAQIACAAPKDCDRNPTVRGLSYFGHRFKSTSSGDIENSYKALEHAIRDDYIIAMYEMDIRTTKDGELVLMHDASTCVTTGINASVMDNTYEDLPILLDQSYVPKLKLVVDTFIERKDDITKPIMLDIKHIGQGNYYLFLSQAMRLEKYFKVVFAMADGQVPMHDVDFLCAVMDGRQIRNFPSGVNLCQK